MDETRFPGSLIRCPTCLMPVGRMCRRPGKDKKPHAARITAENKLKPEYKQKIDRTL